MQQPCLPCVHLLLATNLCRWRRRESSPLPPRWALDQAEELLILSSTCRCQTSHETLVSQGHAGTGCASPLLKLKVRPSSPYAQGCFKAEL